MQFRSLLVLLLLGTTTCFRLSAQSDKFMWDAGFTYQFLREESSYPATSPAVDVNLLSFYGLTGGMNYVVWHSNDKVSLLANPGALVSVSLYGGGLSLFLQAPSYMALHVGAGSTPFNEQKFGVGAGLGVVPSYVYYKTFGFPSQQYKTTMLNPGAMGEITIQGRASLYKIRANWSLSKSARDIDNLHLSYSTFGFGILYVF